MVALERRPRPLPPVPKKLDGEKEARLVQVACSVPPEGRVRWTVKLLAEELVRLEVVESICEETVRQALKKTNGNRGDGKCGAFRSSKATISWPAWSGCSRYTSGRTTRGHPVVCMDEMSKQLSVGSPREVAGTPRVAGEVRRPLPPPMAFV